jgi:DNA-binding PucR family transcriptional regulator
VPIDGLDGRRGLDSLEASAKQIDPSIQIGISNPCKGAQSFAAGFQEAWHALSANSITKSTTVTSYEELGVYKYLIRITLADIQRDAHIDPLMRVIEYDQLHSTTLLYTLERFLALHCNFTATAKELYVHPNTLRQRLARVQELSGVNLRDVDTLALSIAVKIGLLKARADKDTHSFLDQAATHAALPGTARRESRAS